MLDSTVVFSELMYHPSDVTGSPHAETTEWLELHNQMAVDMDLSGWTIDGVDFEFPQNSVLPGGGYLLVAKDPTGFDDHINVVGPFGSRLSNSGETLVLRNASQRAMDTLRFSDRGDWPSGADGTGHSLAKIVSQSSTAIPAHWTISARLGGTPGLENFPTYDPIPSNSTLVARDASWRFSPAASVGNGVGDRNWKAPEFDDSGWPIGEAILFAGSFKTIEPPANGVEPTGDAISISNPSFEANRIGDVGYGVIESWASLGNVGVNPTLTATAPFADNGATPDHRQVGFIQGRGSLTQVVNGMVVGQDYWLEVHYNARDCCRAEPQITINFNGEVLLPPTQVSPVGEQNDYYVALLPFTASTATSPLVIRNVASSGDHTLLIDAVSIVARASNQVPIRNASFESIGSGAPGPLAGNQLAGWQFDGRGVLGAAARGNPVLGGAAVPDGHAIAFLDSTGSLTQTIDGLTVGQRYELRLDASASATGMQAGLALALNEQPVIVAPVVAGDFATFSHRFTATSTQVEFGIQNTVADATLLIDNVMLRAINSPLVTEFADASTTFFRHTFEFNGVPSRTELDLRLFVDDGAVVYLNGQLVSTFNLPADVVNDTAASSEIGDPVWSDLVRIENAALRVGTNLLAVEVHPHGARDRDLAMGIELQATETPLQPNETSLPIAINELPSVSTGPFQIELFNYGSNAIAVEQLAMSLDGQPIALSGEPIRAGATRLVSVTQSVTQHVAENNLLVLRNASTKTVLDAKHLSLGAVARSPDGTGPFYNVSSTTPNGLNRVTLDSSIVINEIMYHAPPNYAQAALPPSYQLRSLVPLDATWRFNDTGSDLPANWPSSRHADDEDWKTGAGFLGFEPSRLIDPGINTSMASGLTTYYAETEFTLSGEQLTSTDTLQLRHLVDDGALFFLNGVEFLRFNLPAEGPVDPQTTATRSVNNAVLSETIELPKQLLIAGTNRLSVQLHQRSATSSDVVLGVQLQVGEIVKPGEPAVPFAEDLNEWLELYNRGNSAVDISGWQLDDAVSFQFPANTRIGAGQYLVVAKETLQLAGQYPTIDIVGPFAGRLSNSDERIVLRDALGNAVDEVHYYDGGRWHDAADGGGSSLELRDAQSDNTRSESWAASETQSLTAWKTYRYRASGVEPANLNVPNAFDELIFGLLDSGVVLLDDIQLIEDPDGAARDVIQNGTFENDAVGAAPAAWRWLGNHQNATVIRDPDSATNQALRLIASGATEHMSNHGETTLAGGASIDSSLVYEIAFRAKWESGSPLLNSRLYFGRAARTTTLETPTVGGTPGTVNSAAIGNIGPSFYELSHAPLVPSTDDAVAVTAVAADPDGIEAMELNYSVDGDPFVQMPMMPNGDGGFVATIPPQARNAIVQFFVMAVDQRDATSMFPAAGPAAGAMYRVDTPVDAGKAHSMRVIMTRADVATLHESANVMSNDRLGATIIYNDNEVFYDVGIRLRASGYGRQGGLAGFNIQFDPQQLFRGVHSTIALDRGAVFSNGDGGGGVQGRSGASPHELLIYQIANRAGGIGAMYDDVVYVDAPRSANTGFALLKMARYSDVYLDSQFDGGSDGSLFKYELIYHATTTTDGDPESLKRAPNAVLGTEITDLGDDANAYRYNFVLKNNRARDDYQSIIELGKVFAMSGSELDTRAPEVMDVDQWMRTFALQSLVGTADTYHMGLAHNLELYVRPSDNRVLALPWDVDHGFYHSTRSNILGIGNSNLNKIINRPQNRRLFYKHLNDIIQHAYNAESVAPWAEHLRT